MPSRVGKWGNTPFTQIKAEIPNLSNNLVVNVQGESKSSAKQLLTDPETQVEVPSLGDRGPRMLSRQALAGVIEPRVEEIYTLVQQVILNSTTTTVPTTTTTVG